MMPSAVLGTRTVLVVRRCDVYGTVLLAVEGTVPVLLQYAEDVVVQYAYEYLKD